MNIVPLLRLFRAHTAILEAPMAIVGASLALGTLYHPDILLWGLFGAMYHFVGYGMNSYVDWKNGFDKNDPAKQHHPLNTGDVSPYWSKVIIYLLLNVLFVYSLWIGGMGYLAFIMTGSMAILGSSYNFFGKYTDYKFIPIATSHTLVFVYPYLHYTLPWENLSSIDMAFILLTGGYFIHHCFQIAVSGDVKDFNLDEAGLLRKYGAEIKKYKGVHQVFMPGKRLHIISWLSTLVCISISFIALNTIGSDYISLGIIFVFSFATLYQTEKVIEVGKYDRDERIKSMSLKEISGYALLHSVVIAVIGLASFAVLIVSMLMYLILMNKIMWGTYVSPRV